MRRSWLVWAASTVAFLLTVLIIVSTGSGSDAPVVSNRSPQQSIFAARAENTAIDRLVENSIKNSAQNLPGASDVTSQPIIMPEQAATADRIADSSVSAASSSPNALATNSLATDKSVAEPTANKLIVGYQPKEVLQLADPSNYGERFASDVNGKPLNNDFIVVLHETVGSASSALNLFARHHPRDEDQVSYHTLIGLDGTVYYVVPPEQRAFGAGDSTFRTAAGEETVTTNPGFPSSVNNFAYHISLETPPDGQNNRSSQHSGYTEAQYQSLAWLLARTTVPDYRITTHKAVDRSGSRSDPRSYEPERLFRWLHQYPSRVAYSY